MFLRKVMENIRPMGPAESHYLLQSLYNMEMGLFNHMDPHLAQKNPLAVVRAFPEEDTQQGSLLEELTYRYRKNRIFERYNINFLDYIKLPCTMARKMDSMAEEIIAPIETEEAKRKAASLPNLDNLDK